jgi:hypothetical protein
VQWVDWQASTGQAGGGTVMAGRGYQTIAALPPTPAPQHDPDLAEDSNFPRLFGGCDLALITASGLDPQVLASLPWPLRRPVA